MSTADGLRRLRERWRAGQAATGTSIALGSILSARAVFQSGWDVATIDMQHGAVADADLPAVLQASVGSATVPFVRVCQNDPAAIMRALDAGALGLFCPQIESAEAARAFVSACYYPPTGTRSIGPLFAERLYGPGYVQATAPELFCFAMIETAKGVAALDEIVATENLTGVYVGTSDLSLSLGYGSRFDPDVPAVAEAVAGVAAAAHAAGRTAAIHVVDAGHVAWVQSLGYDLIVISSDYRLMSSAMLTLAERIDSLVGRQVK